nr:unnamed protein product [Digitaria exilis]
MTVGRGGVAVPPALAAAAVARSRGGERSGSIVAAVRCRVGSGSPPWRGVRLSKPSRTRG